MCIDIILCIGAILDATGSYVYPFLVSGISMALAGVVCLPIRRIARWEQQRAARKVQSSVQQWSRSETTHDANDSCRTLDSTGTQFPRVVMRVAAASTPHFWGGCFTLPQISTNVLQTKRLQLYVLVVLTVSSAVASDDYIYKSGQCHTGLFLERLVSDMTYCVSSGTFNPTHSLTHHIQV